MSLLWPVNEEDVSLLQDTLNWEKSLGRYDAKPYTRLSAWRRTSQSRLWQCTLFLLPSFISSRLTGDDQSAASETVRATAYLDGLRGAAAWAVLNTHLCAVLDKDTGAGWGHGGTNYEIYKLPIVRLIYSGHFAVALFFVISGFALSISFVSSLRKSQPDAATAYKKLASSVFRRPMRLFLPSWVSMFLVFWLIRFNFFGNLQTRQAEFEEFVTGWPTLGSWPPRQSSFFSQLADVLCVCGDMLKIFTETYHESFKLPFNPVLWTIKLEFRSSLVLFLTQAALFFVERRSRVAITVGLIAISVAVSSFDVPHFLTGYLITELTDFTAPPRNRGVFKTFLFATLLTVGLYLGSFAEWDPQNTPQYAWLVPLTPFNFVPLERFWIGVGATLTVWSLNGLPWITSIFDSRLVQYFGKISFALYLVHFWMVQGLGTVIFYHVWSITGKNNFATTATGFCVAYSVLLFLIVWVADIFWRCVDIPFVALAARWQRKLFRE